MNSTSIYRPDWNEYYMSIARTVATRSKDPATSVGCIIVGPLNHILSTGYNGFPSGMPESDHLWSRPMKYSYVVHAEANAICHAAKAGVALEGATLYTTCPICPKCALLARQSGIIRIVEIEGAKPYQGYQEDIPVLDMILSPICREKVRV